MDINIKDLMPEQIADLEEQIAELRKAKKSNRLAWKPENGEEYYVVSTFDGIGRFMWQDLVFESCEYEHGNMFPTEQLAEAELERRKVIREIEELVDKYDSEREGAFVDGCSNYTFYYNVREDSIYTAWDAAVQNPLIPYFSSREVAEHILKEVGEDRVKLLFTKYPIVRGDE